MYMLGPDGEGFGPRYEPPPPPPPPPPTPAQLQSKVNTDQASVTSDSAALAAAQKHLQMVAAEEYARVQQLMAVQREVDRLQKLVDADKAAATQDQTALNSSLKAQLPKQLSQAVTGYGQAAAGAPGAPSLSTATTTLETASFDNEVMEYEQTHGGALSLPGSASWQTDAQKMLGDPEGLMAARDVVASQQVSRLSGNGLSLPKFGAMEWAGEQVAKAQFADPQSGIVSPGKAQTLVQDQTDERQAVDSLSAALTGVDNSGFDPALARQALLDNQYVSTTLPKEVVQTMQGIANSKGGSSNDALGYLYNLVGTPGVDPGVATVIVSAAAPTIQKYLQGASGASTDDAAQTFADIAGLYYVVSNAYIAGVPGAGTLENNLAQWSYSAANATDASVRGGAGASGRFSYEMPDKKDSSLDKLLTKVQQDIRSNHLPSNLLDAWSANSQGVTNSPGDTDNVTAWSRFNTSVQSLTAKPWLDLTLPTSSPGMTADQVTSTYNGAVNVLSGEQTNGALPKGSDPMVLAGIQTEMAGGYGGAGDQTALASAMIVGKQQGLQQSWLDNAANQGTEMPANALTLQAASDITPLASQLGVDANGWSDSVTQADKPMLATDASAPSWTLQQNTDTAYDTLVKAEKSGNQTAIQTARQGWDEALMQELHGVYGDKFSLSDLLENGADGNWLYHAEEQVMQDHGGNADMSKAMLTSLPAAETIERSLDGGATDPQTLVQNLDDNLAPLQLPNADPGGAITQQVLQDARVTSLISGQISLATSGSASDPAAALKKEAQTLAPYEGDPNGVVSSRIINGSLNSDLNTQIVANAKGQLGCGSASTPSIVHTTEVNNPLQPAVFNGPTLNAPVTGTQGSLSPGLFVNTTTVTYPDALTVTAPLFQAAQASPTLAQWLFNDFTSAGPTASGLPINPIVSAAGSVHTATDYRDLAIIYAALPSDPQVVGSPTVLMDGQFSKADLITAFSKQLDAGHDSALWNIGTWVTDSFNGTSSAPAALANDLVNGYQYNDQSGKSHTVGKLGDGSMVSNIQAALAQKSGNDNTSTTLAFSSPVDMSTAAALDGTTLREFNSDNALIGYVSQAYGLPASATPYSLDTVVFGTTTLGQIITGLKRQAGVTNMSSQTPVVLQAAPVTIGDEQVAEFRVQKQDGSIVWLGADGSVTQGWGQADSALTSHVTATTVQIVGGVTESDSSGNVDLLLKTDTVPPPPPPHHPWWESVVEDALAVTAGIVGTAVGGVGVGILAAFLTEQLFDTVTNDGKMTVFQYVDDAAHGKVHWDETKEFLHDTGTEAIKAIVDGAAPGVASAISGKILGAVASAPLDAAADTSAAAATDAATTGGVTTAVSATATDGTVGTATTAGMDGTAETVTGAGTAATADTAAEGTGVTLSAAGTDAGTVTTVAAGTVTAETAASTAASATTDSAAGAVTTSASSGSSAVGTSAGSGSSLTVNSGSGAGAGLAAESDAEIASEVAGETESSTELAAEERPGQEPAAKQSERTPPSRAKRLWASTAAAAGQSAVQSVGNLGTTALPLVLDHKFTWSAMGDAAVRQSMDFGLSTLTGGFAGGVLPANVVVQNAFGFGSNLGLTEVDDQVFDHHNLTFQDVMSGLIMTEPTTLQHYVDRPGGLNLGKLGQTGSGDEQTGGAPKADSVANSNSAAKIDSAEESDSTPVSDPTAAGDLASEHDSPTDLDAAGHPESAAPPRAAAADNSGVPTQKPRMMVNGVDPRTGLIVPIEYKPTYDPIVAKGLDFNGVLKMEQFFEVLTVDAEGNIIGKWRQPNSPGHPHEGMPKLILVAEEDGAGGEKFSLLPVVAGGSGAAPVPKPNPTPAVVTKSKPIPGRGRINQQRDTLAQLNDDPPAPVMVGKKPDRTINKLLGSFTPDEQTQLRGLLDEINPSHDSEFSANFLASLSRLKPADLQKVLNNWERLQALPPDDPARTLWTAFVENPPAHYSTPLQARRAAFALFFPDAARAAVISAVTDLETEESACLADPSLPKPAQSSRDPLKQLCSNQGLPLALANFSEGSAAPLSTVQGVADSMPLGGVRQYSSLGNDTQAAQAFVDVVDAAAKDWQADPDNDPGLHIVVNVGARAKDGAGNVQPVAYGVVGAGGWMHDVLAGIRAVPEYSNMPVKITVVADGQSVDVARAVTDTMLDGFNHKITIKKKSGDEVLQNPVEVTVRTSPKKTVSHPGYLNYLKPDVVVSFGQSDELGAAPSLIAAANDKGIPTIAIGDATDASNLGLLQQANDAVVAWNPDLAAQVFSGAMLHEFGKRASGGGKPSAKDWQPLKFMHGATLVGKGYAAAAGAGGIRNDSRFVANTPVDTISVDGLMGGREMLNYALGPKADSFTPPAGDPSWRDTFTAEYAAEQNPHELADYDAAFQKALPAERYRDKAAQQLYNVNHATTGEKVRTYGGFALAAAAGGITVATPAFHGLIIPDLIASAGYLATSLRQTWIMRVTGLKRLGNNRLSNPDEVKNGADPEIKTTHIPLLDKQLVKAYSKDPSAVADKARFTFKNIRTRTFTYFTTTGVTVEGFISAFADKNHAEAIVGCVANGVFVVGLAGVAWVYGRMYGSARLGPDGKLYADLSRDLTPAEKFVVKWATRAFGIGSIVAVEQIYQFEPKARTLATTNALDARSIGNVAQAAGTFHEAKVTKKEEAVKKENEAQGITTQTESALNKGVYPVYDALATFSSALGIIVGDVFAERVAKEKLDESNHPSSPPPPTHPQPPQHPHQPPQTHAPAPPTVPPEHPHGGRPGPI